MIKHEVLNRLTGKVQFTAEIDCDGSTEYSLKLGLAVRWGFIKGANLNGANLNGANLNGVNLNGASLNGASLNRASLNGASLDRVNLNGAILDGASLNRASLIGASLIGASLDRVNLIGAILDRVNLNGAILDRATYGEGVELGTSPIFLHGILNEMPACSGNIIIFKTHMKIGCQVHSFSEWWKFKDDDISEMDSGALEFWRVWKPVLRQIIKCRRGA